MSEQQPNQPPVLSHTEMLQQQAAARASARALTDNMRKPKTKSGLMVAFYRRENNSFFVMPDGKKLVFAGGVFQTDIVEEIDELEKCIESGGDIHREPVPVHKSDALIMRDVGTRGGATQGGRQTGAMNSQAIASLAAESDFSKG